MKKIIVSGGAGYIGSHMALLLIQNDYEPIIIDNFINSNDYNLKKIKEITGKDFTFYNQNILEDLNKIDVTDVTGIIHFAALKAVGDSVQNPVDYYKNNVAGTINIIKFAIDKKIPNFIFSSTAAIYSPNAPVPLSEDAAKLPESPYGYSKLFCEQILKDAAKAGQLNSIALRYFNVAGNQEDGLIGECAKNPKNLIPSVIVSHLGYRKNNLKVFGNDYPTRDGTAIRDYIHVLDLCNAHLKSLEYLDKNTGYFAFNLGTKNGTTIKEVLNTFELVTGQKLSYQITDRRPGDVAVSIADSTNANKLLNWEPKKDLKSMIDSSLKWYKHGFKIANDL